MYIHQQPHEHGHEQRPRQDMRANNIKREVGKEDETQSLEDIQLVCDLWVYLGVIMMFSVECSEEG